MDLRHVILPGYHVGYLMEGAGHSLRFEELVRFVEALGDSILRTGPVCRDQQSLRELLRAGPG